MKEDPTYVKMEKRSSKALIFHWDNDSEQMEVDFDDPGTPKSAAGYTSNDSRSEPGSNKKTPKDDDSSGSESCSSSEITSSHSSKKADSDDSNDE